MNGITIFICGHLSYRSRPGGCSVKLGGKCAFCSTAITAVNVTKSSQQRAAWKKKAK